MPRAVRFRAAPVLMATCLFLVACCLGRQLQAQELNYVVDTSVRAEVVSFYRQVYLASAGVLPQWTGSVSGCVPGTTSDDHQLAVLKRIAWFRAMAGLPANPVFNPAWNVQCQQAALIMYANGLSHSPPPSWSCYTEEGATAAGLSLLALGVSTGCRAVDLWMQDSEAWAGLGHRRWILYPPQVTWGTGFAGTAHVLQFLGGAGTRPPAPEIVAWPPAGYIPYSVAPATWSLTSATVNLASATVTVTHDGWSGRGPVEVLRSGFGDNGIAWTMSGFPHPRPTEDEVYHVAVANILAGGVSQSFDFDVTVIDPDSDPQSVYLTLFQAERQGQRALIHWAISTPQSHAGFHVWREQPGSVRLQLNDVLLSGQEAYDYVDPAPPAGPADYWLQEVTTDGSDNWYGPAHLEAAPIPTSLCLGQNQPNPFNPSTTFSFSLPRSGRVVLVIYDVRGAQIATLVDADMLAGEQVAEWGGLDTRGVAVPSGVYFARLETPMGARMVKVMLVR